MGGFSTVDEVLHRETGLRMCRKTIRAQQKMLAQSLTQEVEILQQLRHPHIIRLLESYSQGDKLSILLSPVADMTLAVWLEQYPAKPPVGGKDTILQMFGCLTSSVRYLHEQRPLVAHTDIKPQNILIIQGPNKYPHVILNDFGISRASKDHHSELDFGPMTPRYCAPEVADHTSRGPEADIWSLGCVFMEMALVVREKEDNLHQSFRKEFAGRNFYYKDIARVHWWLDRLRETNASCKELLVLETIKAMLGTMPEERPDASSLALVFTPGSCCIAWPSITQHFPGPLEEAKAYEDLLGHAAPFDGAVIAVSMLESPKHAVRFPNALDWMQTCATHHHFCQPPALESQHAGILPARFLEVHPTDSEEYSGHVVSASNLPSTTPYAALSYVWNDDDMLLNSDNIDALYSSVPLDALSKPISDAISVTRKLGLRYLWVDTLCIVQDSESDRREECAAMTDLYRNATVTIAAIHGGFSPERGVTHTNDDHNTYLRPDALWDTRAWSQQERFLSKRTLYLTDSQWYWECPSLRASDTLPKGLPSLLWESIHCYEKHHTVQGLV
jgi:serine/threonine protein kinase